MDDVDEDEADVELREVLARPGAKMTYTYDFGDDWDHEVKLEKIISPDDPAVPEFLPAVLAGSGACPPEDCGGTPGYAAIRRVLTDPRHEDHAHYLEWLGLEDAAEFDPAAFDRTVADLGELKVPAEAIFGLISDDWPSSVSESAAVGT